MSSKTEVKNVPATDSANNPKVIALQDLKGKSKTHPFSIVSLDVNQVDHNIQDELYSIYSSTLELPSGRTELTIQIPVKDILKEFGEAIKGLSNFAGQLIGKLVGGIASGILDSIKDDITSLIGELKRTAEDLIKYATDRLKDVLDKTIDRLDEVLQALVKRVMYMTVLIVELLNQTWDKVSEAVLFWFFEANIAAYDAVAQVPFAKKKPRLVYSKPLWVRGGSAFDKVPRITLRGNYLLKFKKFKIENLKIKPTEVTENELTFQLPNAIVNKIRKNRSGRYSIVIEAKKNKIFGGSVMNRIEIPVLPQLEYTVEASAWPVFNHIRYSTFDVEYDSGKTDDDSKEVVKVHYPPNSEGIVESASNTFINKNSKSYLIDAAPSGSRNSFIVKFYLEGDGGWPFEGGAWFHYKYNVKYKLLVKDVYGKEEQFRLLEESDIDEKPLRISKYFQYPGGKSLLADPSIERLRWKYKCRLKVLAYADNAVADQELLVRDMNDMNPVVAEAMSSINEFGELLVEIKSEEIRNNLKLG